MQKTPALVLIALLGLAACADVGAMPAATAAATTPPPALPAQPGGAVLAGVGPVWQVRRVTCAQLLAAPEPARHDATMFYYGYFAARNGIATIQRNEIAPVLRRVMDQCARAPGMEVADAFQQRLTTPPRWFWQVP